MAIRSANSSKGRISSWKNRHKLHRLLWRLTGGHFTNKNKINRVKKQEIMYGGMFFLEPLKPQIKRSTTNAASDLKACEKYWRHLKALLLGPPFYKQILVQETFGLVPDSSISSLHRLHSCSMPHVVDVQMGICLLYSSLSCKWKRIKRFHHSQSPSYRAGVSRSSHKGHDWARFSVLPDR